MNGFVTPPPPEASGLLPGQGSHFRPSKRPQSHTLAGSMHSSVGPSPFRQAQGPERVEWLVDGPLAERQRSGHKGRPYLHSETRSESESESEGVGCGCFPASSWPNCINPAEMLCK